MTRPAPKGNAIKRRCRPRKKAERVAYWCEKSNTIWLEPQDYATVLREMPKAERSIVSDFAGVQLRMIQDEWDRMALKAGFDPARPILLRSIPTSFVSYP